MPRELRERKGPDLTDIEGWEDFDLELAKLIRKGKFCIDPKTKEVKKVKENEV